jgi:hypothetical protein
MRLALVIDRRVECVWHSTTLRHRVHRSMPDYRRNRVPGGTYFFTVNLLDRDRPLLVEHIELLRESVRRVRELMPFHIDAWVVLPEHMHALWTLPEGMRISRGDGKPSRWRSRSESRQGRRGRRVGEAGGSAEFGSAGIGSTRSGTTRIMQSTWITFISIR